MPPLPSAPDTLKYTLGWHVGGDLMGESVLHFQYSGGAPSATDCATLASDAQTHAAATWPSQFTSVISLATVTVLDLASSTGKQGISASAVNGVRTGSQMAAGVAFVVNHQIAHRYRGGKSKTFLPWGVAGDLTTTQQWASAFITSSMASWNAWITDVMSDASGTTEIVGPAVVSYYSGFTVVTSPTTGRARNVPKVKSAPDVYPITGSVGSSRPGSQRRRN